MSITGHLGTNPSVYLTSAFGLHIVIVFFCILSDVGQGYTDSETVRSG